jgi:DNA damage-binding protein 1
LITAAARFSLPQYCRHRYCTFRACSRFVRCLLRTRLKLTSALLLTDARAPAWACRTFAPNRRQSSPSQEASQLGRMSCNYVSTAHPPSKVTHTAVGTFLGGSERNLLVAKVTRIEVYNITAEGLVCAVELPIYGRIVCMQLFRAARDSQHSLLLVTEKHRLCVLRWDASTAQCVTVLSCNVRDQLGKNVERVPIGIVDPAGRCIGWHQYEHMFKVVPTSAGNDSSAFNLRLLEDEVLDIVFLHGCKKPTIALLSRDAENCVHVKTFAISVADQDMAAGNWSHHDLDASSVRMIAMPAPYCGVVVVADQSISYVSGAHGEKSVSVPVDPMFVRAIGQVDEDGSRFLLGDHMGKLMMLVLDLEPKLGAVQELKVIPLGETSIPAAISYLDNGYIYVGSDFGDSQLVKLLPESNPDTNSHTEVVQTYPHLGPITDFCIVKSMGHLRQGQGQIVTCSGSAKDGSLRIIRNSIGISEQASVELPGIKEMWSLRRYTSDRYHTFVGLGFASETRVYELIGEDEIAPATLAFDEDATTLYMGNLIGDLIVQVTSTGVQLLDCASMNEAKSQVWKPAGDSRVLVAAGNASQLLLAITGGNLIYFEVDPTGRTIVERACLKLGNEIACLNCNPFGAPAENRLSTNATSSVAAVGLWADVNQTPTVQLISLPSLAHVCTVTLDGDVMARSVLMATLENHDYLLIALGDGHLLSYTYKADSDASSYSAAVSATAGASCDEDSAHDLTAVTDSATIGNASVVIDGVAMALSSNGTSRPCVLSDRRRLSVGAQPAGLSLFQSRGSNHVFAACDQPTVVYAERGGGRLLMSNVNLEQVTRVCGFDTEAFPDCLAIATNGFFHVGAVDDVRKLHIQTIPLGQQARRIAHLESARSFAVVTEAARLDEHGDESMEYFVRLIDDTTYESLDTVKLEENEASVSVTCASFSGKGVDATAEFFVVGTALALPHESEAQSGRILVYTVAANKLVQVAELTTRGAVYCLVPYNGRMLAGVNSQVMVLSLTQTQEGILQLHEDSAFSGHVLVWRLQARGDFVLAGDVMRSVTLLGQKAMGNGELEELARDYDSAYTMSLEIMEDDTFIMAEQSKNLLTLQRNTQASSDSERHRLDKVGQYHIGALVNRIQHGSLVLQTPDDSESPALKTMIFGTADGMLGVVATLRPEAFEFFQRVQKAMSTQQHSVGGLSHAEWRQYTVEVPARSAPAKGFVDGDLVESFLDLPLSQATKVADAVDVSVDELTRRVEEMVRLH